MSAPLHLPDAGTSDDDLETYHFALKPRTAQRELLLATQYLTEVFTPTGL